MNILITSASRKVSLIKAFKKALTQEGGGEVIATDINPLSASFCFSDKAIIIPPSNDSSFISTLLSLCHKLKIKLIVPTRDEELLVFSENIDKFVAIGTAVMVSSKETIAICSDKLKFASFCIANGIPVPKTFGNNDLRDGEMHFPLIIKSRFSKGSKNVFRVSGMGELHCLLSYVQDPLIQEYIEGREYTIDIFADFEGRVISVVPRLRLSVFGGESFIGKTVKDYSLIDAAIHLATELKLIGHGTIQCFCNRGDIRFIEVNPRFGGGAALGFSAGANTPLYLIQLLKGKEVKSQIGNFIDGHIMLRYTSDKFLSENEIRSLVTYV
jgi:carbamoyl-phosphate synthase large subunit